MTRLPLYHWVLGYISQARSWIRFQWTSRLQWQRKDAFRRKNLLDRSSEPRTIWLWLVTVVSVEVYPVRYVNPTDLPYVEMWNCYKIARSCDPTNCVYKNILNMLSRLWKACQILWFFRFGIELCRGIANCYQTYSKVIAKTPLLCAKQFEYLNYAQNYIVHCIICVYTMISL